MSVPNVLNGETKSAYLVRLGLATGDRGRFRPEAEAAYTAACEAFGESAFALTKTAQTKADKPAPAPRPTVTTAAPGASAPTGQYDAKVVRKWAEAEGLVERGKRGPLPGTVIARYLSSDAGHVAERARPTPNDMPKRTNVRGLATANGWTHVQDICGNRSCGRSIQRCQCTNGPQSLGGFTQTLSLVEPTA